MMTIITVIAISIVTNTPGSNSTNNTTANDTTANDATANDATANIVAVARNVASVKTSICRARRKAGQSETGYWVVRMWLAVAAIRQFSDPLHDSWNIPPLNSRGLPRFFRGYHQVGFRWQKGDKGRDRGSCLANTTEGPPN